MSNHRRSLRRGKHFSPVLAASWNKHGESSFECEVLELVPDAKALRDREQHWIDARRCVCPNGYNISSNATSNAGLAHSTEWIEKVAAANRNKYTGFISPSGQATTISNMATFCKYHNLTPTAMYDLAHGKIANHKGWTNVNAKKSLRMVAGPFDGLIDPSGKEVGIIFDLLSFCRDRGLKRKNILRLIRGDCLSYMRWTHKMGRPRSRPENYDFLAKTIVGFYDPSGNPVTIKNLSRFCREKNLCSRAMERVRSGEVRHHHGWRFGSPEHRNRRSRTNPITIGFVDPSGRHVPFRNKGEFLKEHSLANTPFWRLATGQIKQYKGWTYRPELAIAAA